ncbi:MAG: class I tRNA ligase family protein [Candidatus Roizmanbacteria bacterium]
MATFKKVDQKHNFIQMEKDWLKRWYEGGTIRKYLTKNSKSKKRFSFLDGPITANNPMGVHHGWGRTYKDVWQKFYNLLGYKQRFQNGFDCQGLWVEVEVEKELGIRSKKDIENLVLGDKKASIAKFVDMCKQRVYKYSNIQTDQSKRLGYFMDWDNSYFTMSEENNYMIWYFLKQCFKHGWIYKGHDSVPWCPRCETAISQHEMLTEDYKELTHETVFLKLPILSAGWDRTSLLIWTTTPWTIPANVAVGVNVKFTYGVWEHKQSKERLIFISQDETGVIPTRADKKRTVPVSEYIFKNIEEAKEYEMVKEIKGSNLVGLSYTAPFDNLEIVQQSRAQHQDTFHTVVDGSEIVVSTEGTGLLHVATGAGQEDFILGKKFGLSVLAIIEDNADYVKGMGELTGKNAKKHPELIIDLLKNINGGSYLLKTMMFTHRYPACWRCKTELVWKVADEWYIAMDKVSQNDTDKRTLRERMVEVAKKIAWIPEFGLDRELDWLKNMHDWLISKKNRYWGLALPIWVTDDGSEFEVIESKEELKSRAISGFEGFEGHTPHKPYIDDIVITSKITGKPMKRIDDVGNPWLDAGIVPYSTLIDPVTGKASYLADKKYFNEWFPANFITESFPGQFKNWFYAMIAMSTVLEDNNPYETVLGFASAVGEDGRPMHKSWGNSIEFNEGADNIGVDVMRWMYTRQNYTDNLLFGYKRADEIRRQFFLMLWNIYNYFIEYSIIDSWKKPKEVKQLSQIIADGSVLDQWITYRFIEVTRKTEMLLKSYNSKEATQIIEDFVNDLSTWYIRRSRNRVWIHNEDVKDKEAFFSTLHFILTNISVILSPFLPFVTEEIYTNLTNEESVHLSSWPEVPTESIVEVQTISDMALLRDLIESSHRVRKELKLKVRQPLASVNIILSKGTMFKLQKNRKEYEQLICDEINVKYVEISQGDSENIDVVYDTTMTDELIHEGKLRDLIRSIQAERKSIGVTVQDFVKVIITKEFESDIEYIKKAVLAKEVNIGDQIVVSV